MEIFIIFILTLLNAFFALSEISLVSVKRSRIEHLAEQGHLRAKTILKLLDKPENFLSSVQVGITLIEFRSFVVAVCQFANVVLLLSKKPICLAE